MCVSKLGKINHESRTIHNGCFQICFAETSILSLIKHENMLKVLECKILKSNIEKHKIHVFLLVYRVSIDCNSYSR